MSISALAYTNSITPGYYYGSDHVSFSNTVSTNSPASNLTSLQVDLYIYKESNGAVVCNVNNIKDSPTTNSLVISFSKATLPSGRYVDEATGYVAYIPNLAAQNEFVLTTKVFKHTVGSYTTGFIAPDFDSVTAIFASRGVEIAKSFGVDTDDYKC